MSDKPGPVFLEKQGYRRRRLIDAARLLPVFGAALLLIPLLWVGTGGAMARTTYAMIYVFGIWLLLVGVSALISWHLMADDGKEDDTRGGEG